jgi:hydrogenase expression/formation protein HypE
MKEGKLNWDDLKEIISENKGVVREEVRVHSGIGEDCSIIKFGDYECVISTDPITGADSNIGKLAVNINCNDIASCGVEPIGIMVTILAPEGATLEQIKTVMKEIGEEAKKLNIEILGGHTEVTSAVNKLIVSCTVIGKSLYGKAISTSGAKLGDDVVVTKYLAMEGSSILANDYEDELKTVLTDEEIKTAKDYANDISVIKEGRLAGEFGVDSMHDITEGGVLGALWEMAEASQVGFKVFEKAMPISEVTKKICNRFDIDPLKFISSGSMLIVTQNGEALVKLMKQKNIKATIIGKITEKKGILVKDNMEIEVDPPERDELFNI